MTEYKKCKDCCEELPIDEFGITHRKGSRNGGKRNLVYKSDVRSCYCRLCANIRKRAYQDGDAPILPYFTSLAPLPAWLEPRI